ncbi:MAG: TonB-dependent receptor [Saprospiraceae bacterium]
MRSFKSFGHVVMVSLLLVLTLTVSIAQHSDSTSSISNLPALKINGDYRGVKVLDILAILRDRYGITFYFDPAIIPDYEVSVQFRETPFLEAMQILFNGTTLAAAQIKPGAAIITPKAALNREYANKILAAWEAGTMGWPQRKLFQEMTLSFGNPNKTTASKTFQFKGKITDAFTGEPIVGATILATGSQKGTDTDANGKFDLALSPGTYSIDIQYIGYQGIKLQLSLYDNATQDFALEQLALNLSEVVIRAKPDDTNVRSTQIGVENLAVKSIKQLPTALGEADVIKALETLPGVSTVGEGSAGFNVRGGNIDQNLIIQDGAPILNTAHAIGFLSAFNPDVISGVSLYKGGIPAQYGGRLSSVLEVRIKDGDFQQWHGGGGLGFAYSRLYLEGPLLRNRTSIILGARLSYSDWMLRAVRDNQDIRNSSLWFRDFTGKITQRLGEKNFVTLSGFQSGDYFRYSNQFGYQWGTRLYTLGWNYLASDKLSASFKAIAGNYESELFEPSGANASRLANGLRYYVLKENIFYQPHADYQINAGIEWTRYEAQPEELRPYSAESSITPQTVLKDRGDEMALYANAEINLNARWSVAAGLRYSRYAQLGPRDVYLYNPEVPRTVGAAIDTFRYGSSDAIQTYDGWEPRLSLKYSVSPNSSVKLGYNRLWQYIHLISNTAAATPVDFWQVSTLHIPPQSTHNFSLGYFQNVKNNLWQLSLELYYKHLENLVTYKELPDLLVNNRLETQLLAAQGKAYGFEIAARKTSGKWNGQLSYTFARSLQRTNDAFPSETINSGNWFPTNFDQPHQINITWRGQPNPIHAFTFSFTYRTGRPYTIPTSNYSVGGIVISQYSQRNEGRIPAYHRLDFSYQHDNSAIKDRGFRQSFTFSLYNLYFHKNAFSVFFRRNNVNQQEAYRLSLIGTALPAFSWNFVF